MKLSLISLPLLALACSIDALPQRVPSFERRSFAERFPTGVPTGVPTGFPTTFPSGVPSGWPTGFPTTWPTGIPTGLPTGWPTGVPTGFPGFPRQELPRPTSINLTRIPPPLSFSTSTSINTTIPRIPQPTAPAPTITYHFSDHSSTSFPKREVTPSLVNVVSRTVLESPTPLQPSPPPTATPYTTQHLWTSVLPVPSTST